LVRAYLLRNKSINVWTTVHSMTSTSPQEYIVDMTAAMAAKGVDLNQEAARLKADIHHFELTFVDEEGNGEWKVERAQWRRGF